VRKEEFVLHRDTIFNGNVTRENKNSNSAKSVESTSVLNCPRGQIPNGQFSKMNFMLKIIDNLCLFQLDENNDPNRHHTF